MKHHTRHKRIWSFLRLLLIPWLRHKFRTELEVCDIPGPCLVLANHDSNWDPLLLGCAFPQHMYFVASEHIFRWGLVSAVIRWLLDPISRLKGTTAGDTALTIVRRLRKGCSVAMFANGSRSFSGISEDILPSTGKLARAGSATLVTYRLDGGYFTEPRWNTSGLRRGKITGRVMNVYTPQQLKSMSVDEINERINADLYVDAYAVQRENMIPFTGKRLAEGLETTLCLCPACGGLNSLRSQGDHFRCRCGYDVRYTEYGFFEGENLVFDSVTDWDKWQTSRLQEMADSAQPDSPIFQDEGFVLYEISTDHKSRVAGRGDIALYRDCFVCCGTEFPLSELNGFALHGPTAVNFSSGNHFYELKPDGLSCTRKYATVIAHLAANTARVAP